MLHQFLYLTYIIHTFDMFQVVPHFTKYSPLFRLVYSCLLLAICKLSLDEGCSSLMTIDHRFSFMISMIFVWICSRLFQVCGVMSVSLDLVKVSRSDKVSRNTLNNSSTEDFSWIKQKPAGYL